MYPNPSNLYDLQWGMLWFLARINNGPWMFYETCGPAVILQLQRLLQTSVEQTDVTYDGSQIGPALFTLDGVVGTQTLRRLWVLARKRYAPTEQTNMLAQLIRTRPNNAVITPWLTQLILWLLYPALASVPANIQLSIAGNGAPQIGSPLNIPIRTEAQAVATPGLLTAQPTSTLFNDDLPDTSIRSLEALRNTNSGTQSRDVGPWTVETSPIGPIAPLVVVGQPTQPVFTPLPTTSQPSTQPSQNLPPVPTDPVPSTPEPQLPVTTTPTKTPAPPQQTSALGTLATSVADVGKRAMPYLPYAGAAVGTLGVLLLLRRLIRDDL